jgi:hypothetical protein
LPQLALNLDPPDLCLLSSQDYMCEPPVPCSPIFSFAVLGIKPRALAMLSTHVTTELHPQSYLSLPPKHRDESNKDKEREPSSLSLFLSLSLLVENFKIYKRRENGIMIPSYITPCSMKKLIS